MIDAGPPVPHTDLTNVVLSPLPNPIDNLALPHAFHVAGILSAASNNSLVRGINPGAQIISVNRGSTDAEIRQAFDWVLADSEFRGIYAVATISTNGFWFADGNPAQLANFMRRMSTRLLVVQSAGNQHDDACGFAYGPAQSNDGLIVVSAVGENGQQPVPFATNTQGWGGFPGANFGPCVEMWAPGQRVLSTWNNPANSMIDLSGTSMAAPHVAALAARYGTTTTTPVQREHYIRSKLQWTGFNDDHGAAIVVPSYVQPPSLPSPSRLLAQEISSDSTYAGTSRYYVNDSLYLTPGWNAGHYAPAWIELDLGSPRKLTGIRLTPDQSPDGDIVHEVYAGNMPEPTALAAVISGTGRHLEPLSAELDVTARYVRILTTASPSWVAWREVEVYGYVERARHDWNADGYSDVLWRDAAGGQNYQWQMSGLAIVNQGYLPTVQSSWSPAGVGDFAGDGKSDIIWRDNAGQNYMWMMDGLSIISQGYLPSVLPPWAIVGIGDADGDGKKDVFWRDSSTGANSLWIMDGLTVAAQGSLPSVSGTDWEVVGVADHTGDGKADVLWRNKVTGDNYLWIMNGLSVVNQGYLPTVVPTDWEVVGTPDANGDARADVMWRNKVTGDNYLWIMNGLAVASQGYLPAVSDTAWKVMGWGDYDADGRGDALWRNGSSGENYVWLLNGIAVSLGGYLPSIAGSNWGIVK